MHYSYILFILYIRYIYIIYIYIYMPEVCTCQEYMHALNKCILEIYIFCSTGSLISYSFSCPCKALTMLHHRSVVRVQNKDYYFIFLVVFLSCNMCFYYFHFFFWWSIKLSQQNFSQSETEVGDKKLSVELYDTYLRDICMLEIYAL